MKNIQRTLFWLCGVALMGTGCHRPVASHLLDVYRMETTQMGRPMEYALLRAPVSVTGDLATPVPVFVLLHGMGDDHTTLDRQGISAVLQDAMKKGEIPLAHFILPNGERGFYVDWYDGSHPYEKTIMRDVIPSALSELGLRADYPLHIIGVSMGGQGALRIGLTYPHRFASIGVFSTMIFTEAQAKEMMDRRLVKWFIKPGRIFGDGTDAAFSRTLDVYSLSAGLEPDLKPRIFITSGTAEKEVFLDTAEQFAAHLDEVGVPHMYTSYEGGHGWAYWQQVLPAAIRYGLGGAVALDSESHNVSKGM